MALGWFWPLAMLAAFGQMLMRPINGSLQICHCPGVAVLIDSASWSLLSGLATLFPCLAVEVFELAGEAGAIHQG